MDKLATKSYRTRFMTYSTLNQALAYNEELSSYCQSLNGKWAFKYLESPEITPIDFLNGKYQALEWQTIEVPGHIELQGYGKPMYSNFDYPFPVTPPDLPAFNPTGLYLRKFIHNKSEMRQTLRFDGVDSAFEVWLNGCYVGQSQGSRLLSEFDVTSFLKEGENKLAVRVTKWSLGSYLEDQDMWWLSGIFRDVNLIEESSVVEDIKVTPQKENGQWQIRVDIVNLSQTRWSAKSLLDVKSKLKFEQDLELKPGHNRFIIPIENPVLWSNELPNLYTLILQVSEKIFIPIRFGLRVIELKNNLICLNDVPVLFNGVNRHEFDPKTGRTLTKKAIYNEVRQIKRNHINAIRTSHYPNTPYFYDVCDELGMLVIDECDIETHGFSAEIAPAIDSFWKNEFIERGLRMVHRDYNHPCVLIWSLGNESHFGPNFVAMAESIRSLDSSRLIHYEGDRQNEITDMYSTMYTSIEDMQKRASLKINKLPHILCEYGHAMGNGPGSLKEYQDLFNLYDSIQGGFIWEWKDHGLVRTQNNHSYFAYGGDFGEAVHDGDFVIDGLVLPNGIPSPGLDDYKQVIQPFEFYYHKCNLRVKSLYKFKTLSNHSLLWELQENGVTIESGKTKLQTLKPATMSNLIVLPIESTVKSEAYLTVSIIANEYDEIYDKGEILARYQTSYHQSNDLSQTKIEVSNTDSELTIMANSKTYTFNKSSGQLKQIQYKEECFLRDEMHLSLWRQPISNDMYTIEKWNGQYLKEISARSRSFNYYSAESSCLIVSRQYIAPPVVNWGIETELVIWITADGAIDIKVKGWFDGIPPSELPRIGYELPLIQKIDEIIWFGRGPGESYPDSHNSTFFGKYQKNWKDWRFPYIVSQETGNRSEVRWSKVTLNNQHHLDIEGVEPFHLNGVVDDSKKNKESVNHLSSPSIPKESISLRIDNQVRGLGSNSCGPEPLSGYKVFPTPFEMQFNLDVGSYDN